MKESQSVLAQSTVSGEDIERYEVIDGVRVKREPMGAFETVLASWLCYLINGFVVGKKLGLAVNEEAALYDSSSWQYLRYMGGEDTDSDIVGGPFGTKQMPWLIVLLTPKAGNEPKGSA